MKINSIKLNQDLNFVKKNNNVSHELEFIYELDLKVKLVSKKRIMC